MYLYTVLTCIYSLYLHVFIHCTYMYLFTVLTCIYSLYVHVFIHCTYMYLYTVLVFMPVSIIQQIQYNTIHSLSTICIQMYNYITGCHMPSTPLLCSMIFYIIYCQSKNRPCITTSIKAGHLILLFSPNNGLMSRKDVLASAWDHIISLFCSTLLGTTTTSKTLALSQSYHFQHATRSLSPMKQMFFFYHHITIRPL